MYDLIFAWKFEHESAFKRTFFHPPAVKQPHSVALPAAPDAPTAT